MPVHKVPYEATHQFAPLVLDHLAGTGPAASARPLPPSIQGIDSASRNRELRSIPRALLHKVLMRQYTGIDLGPQVEKNINSLLEGTTLTVTTGHQLCLFTGPLYVPLKILNTIRLARDLTRHLGNAHVVPIFWMATEDHDRDEIDHAIINGKRITWPGPAGGPVGRMRLVSVKETLEKTVVALGPGTSADELRDLLYQCYTEDRTLTEATRSFIHALFGRSGIVCLDADDPDLKRMLLPIVRKELHDQFTSRAVSRTNELLAPHYKLQAHAREINLFYMDDGLRSKIMPAGGSLITIEGKGRMPMQDLLDEFDAHPERCSPNVLLRPLYQELLLPNVAYIGGGGELAYWLQLGEVFTEARVQMPVLLLRTSAAFLSHKEHRRMQEIDVTFDDLFRSKEELHRSIALMHSGLDTDLSGERAEIGRLYSRLEQRSIGIDPTLGRSAGSAQHLAMKGLDHLEKRFVRAAKARVAQQIDRAEMVREVVFPNGTLQERQENFMTFYTRAGRSMFDEMLEHLDPLEQQFSFFVEQ